MRFIELHYEGGPLFMGILLILLLINLVLIGKSFYEIYGQNQNTLQQIKTLNTIKFIAGFALAFGILGQIIGLYDAFNAIQQAGEVSQAMLAGGLRVSTITTLYGFFIFLFSSLCWYFLQRKITTV
ncbi:hypothetical protein BH23BAC1_BH23BAC1_40600 [soil metagenome]